MFDTINCCQIFLAMRSDIPIPLWLRQKTANRLATEVEPSGKLMPALILGAIVSYFGLTALRAAHVDKKNVYAAESAQNEQKSYPSPAYVYESRPENTQISLRELNDRDLMNMETYLEAVNDHAAGMNLECVNGKRKFNSRSMIYPSRYLETHCLAEASRELFNTTNDIKYLELAGYYYKRCLYLIDGQMEGKFRKPKGGNEEIRRRQQEVYLALDNVRKIGRD